VAVGELVVGHPLLAVLVEQPDGGHVARPDHPLRGADPRHQPGPGVARGSALEIRSYQIAATVGMAAAALGRKDGGRLVRGHQVGRAAEHQCGHDNTGDAADPGNAGHDQDPPYTYEKTRDRPVASAAWLEPAAAAGPDSSSYEELMPDDWRWGPNGPARPSSGRDLLRTERRH